MLGKIFTLGLTCSIAFSLLIAGSSAAFNVESIVGVWLFDEGKGDEILDSSGKEHNGAIIGADVDRVDGKFGEALEFIAGGKVEVPHADEFTTPTFTLMAWVNVDKPTASWQLIVGKDGWPNRNYAMFVAKDSGVMHYAFCSPGKQDIGNFNTPKLVADGEWHHLAMTYDLKMRRAYVDGELNAENPLSDEPSESPAAIEIGRSVVGVVDEVLIANEPFSEEDIKLAKEAGLEKLITGGAAVSVSGKLTGTWGSIRSGRVD